MTGIPYFFLIVYMTKTNPMVTLVTLCYKNPFGLTLRINSKYQHRCTIIDWHLDREHCMLAIIRTLIFCNHSMIGKVVHFCTSQKGISHSKVEMFWQNHGKNLLLFFFIYTFIYFSLLIIWTNGNCLCLSVRWLLGLPIF